MKNTLEAIAKAAMKQRELEFRTIVIETGYGCREVRTIITKKK